ncbi:MAG: MFS transporter [Clostridiales Family XIII bacterium]|jgi:MFS family permease|nr:MFS transporter [Clostridiales Family XIII bacterium]
MCFRALPATSKNITVIGYLAYLGYSLHFVLRSVVLPAIKADFGLTFTQSGFLFGTASIAYFVTTGFSGKISQWIGQRASLSVYLAAQMICALGLALTANFAMLIAFFLLSGACYGGIECAAIVLATRYCGNDAHIVRARMFGVFCVGGAVSAVMGSGFVHFGIGWRTAFVLVGAVCFIPFFISLFIDDLGADAAPKIEFAQLGGLFRNRAFMLSCIALTLSSGAENASNIWMMSILTTSPGMNVFVSGCYTAAYYLSVFVGRTFLISMFERFKRPKTALCLSVGSGFFVLLVSFVSDTDTIFAAIVVFGLIVSCVYPLMISIASGQTRESLVFPFSFAMISAGSFSINLSTGAVADFTGISNVFRFNAILFVAAAALIFFNRSRVDGSGSPENR